MADKSADQYRVDTPDPKSVKAYMANHAAHREGISTKEMADYYTVWAKDGSYETDACPGRYDGPAYCAEAVAELYNGGKDRLKILDVGAGTGFLGEQLAKRGFKDSCMDALDPSQGMLDVAKEKGVYKEFICEAFGVDQTSIKDDAYDCLAIAGGMGEGHIPASAINEMIRVVKPGGYVVIAMREEYIQYVKDYRDLEKNMRILEDNKVWKRITRKILPNYSFAKNGLLFVYEIL